MGLLCIVVICLRKSHGAADLLIKDENGEKLFFLPRGRIYLSDLHLRECAGIVQCVLQCFTHIGPGSFWYGSTAKRFGDGGFKEPQALPVHLIKHWTMSVLSLLPVSRRLS